MTVPSAKIIADSISPEGVRLTTFEVVMHRFVLAEFNTHRTLSRNSASSRAIPVAKQIKRVRETPATPMSWPAEQKGMQGGSEIDEPRTLGAIEHIWDEARWLAASAAEELSRLGLHKSVTNRLLEPFMWHTVVVTATAWENFFEQRCSPLAQPEIRMTAAAMKAAYSESMPMALAEGDGNNWHLPYITTEDRHEVVERAFEEKWTHPYHDVLAKVSAARCARVSYLTQDGKRDLEADLALYERLVTANPKHWSPLEHVATPWAANRQSEPVFFDGPFHESAEHPGNDTFDRIRVDTGHLPKVGNLLGWRSLRTTVEATHGERTFR